MNGTGVGEMNSERFVIDTNGFILRFNDRLTELLPRGKRRIYENATIESLEVDTNGISNSRRCFGYRRRTDDNLCDIGGVAF